MLKHFLNFLTVKEQEETWFSFVVYRFTMLLLFVYLLDFSLPSHISKIVDGKVNYNTYTDYSRVRAQKYSDVSMDINGRSVQDYEAIKDYNLGAELFIHQSYIFGFVKFFHTESGNPKIWINSFSPMGVFCFIPIIMFLALIAYFYSRHSHDYDFVLKISVMEFILCIVLLWFMAFA